MIPTEIQNKLDDSARSLADVVNFQMVQQKPRWTLEQKFTVSIIIRNASELLEQIMGKEMVDAQWEAKRIEDELVSGKVEKELGVGVPEV